MKVYHNVPAVVPHTMALTNGQAATLCQVAPMTMSRWVDRGELRGYRIPGSNERRIPAGNLYAFMVKHQMPVPPCLAPKRTFTLGLAAGEYIPGATAASDGFDLGVMCSQATPRAVFIGDADGYTVARKIATHLKTMHPHADVWLIVSEDAPLDEIEGIRVHRRPCDWKTILASAA